MAGDWDLRRRFAEFEPLYVLDFPLGKFSQSAGRLSEDISHYYREVDEILPTLSTFMCDDRNTYKIWRYIGQTDWTITVTPEHIGEVMREASKPNNEQIKKMEMRSLISRMCTPFWR